MMLIVCLYDWFNKRLHILQNQSIHLTYQLHDEDKSLQEFLKKYN